MEQGAPVAPHHASQQLPQHAGGGCSSGSCLMKCMQRICQLPGGTEKGADLAPACLQPVRAT